MRPLEPEPEARAHHVGVDPALGITGADPAKCFEISVVEQVRGTADHNHFVVGLDPAHAVHERRTLGHVHLRQPFPDRFPVQGAEVILLEADFRRGKAGVADDFGEFFLGRVDVRLV